jgi:ubiquinone/menaquinone biosynthesis C-methylase UbiE
VIPKGNLQSNVDRFLGFENLYDKYRPEAPQLVVNIIMNYLQTRLSLIVDLGCGTGLSSFIWENHAEQIIGIEPNPDMIGKARQKLQQNSGVQNISFVQGYSNQMDVGSESVDVLTCSQSFHWMEPASTLQEVSRVLRDGGIFAAYDYDWPPTLDWRIEDLFSKLMNKSNSLTAGLWTRIIKRKNGAKMNICKT